MHIADHIFIDISRTLRPIERVVALAATLLAWRRRSLTRRHLRLLDQRELDDVGIDPASRRREIAKWFWQP
jgi:uncharacterized protein YjiS (DUF1127 family)